jgi:hypothetical protein
MMLFQYGSIGTRNSDVKKWMVIRIVIAGNIAGK